MWSACYRISPTLSSYWNVPGKEKAGLQTRPEIHCSGILDPTPHASHLSQCPGGRDDSEPRCDNKSPHPTLVRFFGHARIWEVLHNHRPLHLKLKNSTQCRIKAFYSFSTHPIVFSSFYILLGDNETCRLANTNRKLTPSVCLHDRVGKVHWALMVNRNSCPLRPGFSEFVLS